MYNYATPIHTVHTIYQCLYLTSFIELKYLGYLHHFFEQHHGSSSQSVFFFFFFLFPGILCLMSLHKPRACTSPFRILKTVFSSDNGLTRVVVLSLHVSASYLQQATVEQGVNNGGGTDRQVTWYYHVIQYKKRLFSTISLAKNSLSRTWF